MKKTILLIILMITSFFVSGLFFLNSGMIGEDDCELDELRTVSILEELDKIPLVHFDEIKFKSRGTLMKFSDQTISIHSHNGDEAFFHSENLSNFREEDKVIIYYRYSSDDQKEITNIKKI